MVAWVVGSVGIFMGVPFLVMADARRLVWFFWLYMFYVLIYWFILCNTFWAEETDLYVWIRFELPFLVLV